MILLEDYYYFCKHNQYFQIMRKLILLTLVLSVFSPTFGRQISLKEAQRVASDFISCPDAVYVSAEAVFSEVGVDNGVTGQAYYVFNSADKEGFVIVSGDDRFSKVIGYCDKGEFNKDKMPPQLAYMLENFSARVIDRKFSGETHRSWRLTRAESAETNEVLIPTAQWGQGYPYNALCPDMGGSNAPAGCVATAMAIVMKHNNWPEGYDWNAMPMEIKYAEGESPEAQPEIAKLMKDAGEAVYMQYGLEESGANMNWVGHKMQQKFHYSPECQFISSDNFPSDRWNAMIKNNLDQNHPVIYSGSGSGSHAFVIDGYRDGEYHINWGWDGYCNGYFALDALTPNEVQDFSKFTGMVINLVPDKSGEIYSECFVDKGYFYGIGDETVVMNPSVKDVVKGEPFHLANDLVTYPEGFEGEIGLALVSDKNEIKEVLKSMGGQIADVTVHYSGSGTNFTNVLTTVDVDPTDRLQLVTKRYDEREWRLVLGTLERASYVGVTGNTPQTADVKVNVGDGVFFRYNLGIDGDQILEPGSYTFKDVLQGLNFEFYCSSNGALTDNRLILSIKGTYAYGNSQNFSSKGEPISTYLTVYGDSEFDTRIIGISSQTVHLEEAGTLEEKMQGKDVISIVNLTVSGKMNARDFWFIRDNFPCLESLDLGKVTVEAVTAADDSFKQFDRDDNNPANAIPEFGLPSLRHLSKLILPESLTGILLNSLCDLKLSSINIPKGVTEIGLNALSGNSDLIAVGIQNPDPIYIHDCVFTGTRYQEGTLFVPEGTVDKFKGSAVWQDFGSIIEGTAPDVARYEVVADGVRYDCLFDYATVTGYEGEPVDIVIPEKVSGSDMTAIVKKIGDRAFESCKSIETVTMPNSVTEIGVACFAGCDNLKSVKLSENITALPEQAFSWCGNLVDMEIPANVKSLARLSLAATGLTKITIRKDMTTEDTESPFGYNSALVEFIVEEGNKIWEAIEGVLYRKNENGIVLESMPGKKSGTVILPSNVTKICGGAVAYSDIESLVINKDCAKMEYNSIALNEYLQHIILPANASVSESAINQCFNLNSVTFTGDLETHLGIFANCQNLENIIVDSEENVNLDGIFGAEVAEQKIVNIFSPALERNYEYSDDCVVYVPGAATEGHGETRASEVKEMWEYALNRNEGIFCINPLIDNIKIDKVIVNGKEVARKDGVYPIAEVGNIDIKVDYTLFDHQQLTTHYTNEFNSAIQDSVVSGISGVMIEDDDVFDLYGADGMLRKKNCNSADLQNQTPGMYILKYGNRTVKIVK